MKFVAILSLGVTVAIAAVECPAYVCDPKDYKWDSNTCGVFNTNNETEYFIRSVSCPSNQECHVVAPATASVVCTAIQTIVNKRYPGEPCSSSYPCTSTCTSGKCTTMKVGDACVNAYDCDVTMTCIDKVCTLLAGVGSSCSQDSDCVSSAGCAIATEGGTGTCVNYLSIAAGTEVKDTCANNINRFCSTGYCFTTATNSICAQPVTTVGSIPLTCTTGGPACTSTKDANANEGLPGSCGCGFSGYKYCTLNPGDSEVSEYLTYLAEFLGSSEINTCSTYRKDGGIPSYATDCWSQAWANDKKLYSLYKALYYQMFATADKCVIKLLRPDIYAVEGSTLLVLAGFALLN